jgi:hypothetical protein
VLLVRVLNRDAEILDETDTEEVTDGDCDWLGDEVDDSVFVPDRNGDTEAELVIAAEGERFDDEDPEFDASFIVCVITEEDDTLVDAHKLVEPLFDPRARPGPVLKVAK